MKTCSECQHFAYSHGIDFGRCHAPLPIWAEESEDTPELFIRGANGTAGVCVCFAQKVVEKEKNMTKTAESCVTPGCCTCPDMPRCPKCGYTAHDAAHLMDHNICDGVIPGDRPRWAEESLAKAIASYHLYRNKNEKEADAVEQLTKGLREAVTELHRCGATGLADELTVPLEAAERWQKEGCHE